MCEMSKHSIRSGPVSNPNTSPSAPEIACDVGFITRNRASKLCCAFVPTSSSSAFFCPFAKCEVVYFDMFERRVTVDQLRHGVYPKDPQAPICGCYGMTLAEVEADAQAGEVARVRELLSKAKSGHAPCRTESASGQPCTAEVQRAYMRARGG